MLFIAKHFVNRILHDNQWDRLGVEDPYHITIDVKKGNRTVQKTVPRPMPDGITENDQKVLNEFKKRAVRYDQWFKWGSVKFGWALMVNLIPAIGPVISTYWLLRLLWLTRLLSDPFPLDLLLLFLVNMALDFALGLIPIVGSLIVIGYKANLRNYLLLERHLNRIGQRNQGKIEPEEVRPGFINDRVQPFVEKEVYPEVVKASGKVADVMQEKVIPAVKDTVKRATEKKAVKDDVQVESHSVALSN